MTMNSIRMVLPPANAEIQRPAERVRWIAMFEDNASRPAVSPSYSGSGPAPLIDLTGFIDSCVTNATNDTDVDAGDVGLAQHLAESPRVGDRLDEGRGQEESRGYHEKGERDSSTAPGHRIGWRRLEGLSSSDPSAF
jgi:hypothetical protein